MSQGVSLNDIQGPALAAMQTSDKNLKAKIGSLSNGDTVTAVDLLQAQMLLTSNSLTGEISSSLAKQRKDTEEGIVQKF